MREDHPLTGRRVIVTGASRGIGRATAIACAHRGATVGINFSRSENDARAVADEIGDNAILLQFDVRDPSAIAVGFEMFVSRAGGLDALVNNAAIVRPSLLVSATDADVDAVVQTNVIGPILCTRAAIPTMLRARHGVILNISSIVADRPWRGQSVYAATKGAIEAFTRAVAVEYERKGIRCHCIRPGAVDTDMLAATRSIAGEDALDRMALKRLLKPEEIADLAVTLLGDRCQATTGAVHTLDGGFAAG